MRPYSSALLALLLLAPCRDALAGSPGPIGVLGDSYSDEYQFYPPDRTTARNWVEILSELRGLDFGPFSTSSRGEPRNQGFAYNWARSDATTDDMIAGGQLAGLTSQVAEGKVKVVLISIGGNDFIHAFQSTDPAAALERIKPRTLENVRIATETILAAHDDVKVVLVTLSDIRNLPEIDEPIRSGRFPSSLADEYGAAIGSFNVGIRSLAAKDRRIALLDLDRGMRVANLINREQLVFADVRLDRVHASNRLDSLFIADGRHLGTMGQGLLAKMFVDILNHQFGADVPPLVGPEILQLARSIPASPPSGTDRKVAGLDAFSGGPKTPVATP